MGKYFKNNNDVLDMIELVKINFSDKIKICTSDVALYEGDIKEKLDISSYKLNKGDILKLYINISNLWLYFDKEVYDYNSFKIEFEILHKYIEKFKRDIDEVVGNAIN